MRSLWPALLALLLLPAAPARADWQYRQFQVWYPTELVRAEVWLVWVEPRPAVILPATAPVVVHPPAVSMPPAAPPDPSCQTGA